MAMIVLLMKSLIMVTSLANGTNGVNAASVTDEASTKTIMYCTQTDMTMKDLNEIESDLQSYMDEIHSPRQEMHNSRGYSTMEQLQNNKNSCPAKQAFDCSNMLIAIFEFQQKGNT